MRMIGNFEELVLLAVDTFRENGENYGAKIRGKLEYALGRKVIPYVVHTTLKRLEERGLVASTTFPKIDPSKKGRRPKMYLLTPEGVSQLRMLHKARRRITRQQRNQKTAA